MKNSRFIFILRHGNDLERRREQEKLLLAEENESIVLSAGVELKLRRQQMDAADELLNQIEELKRS